MLATIGWGVFLALAVILGMFISWKKAKEYHIEDNVYLDKTFGVLFWGLAGARFVYIIFHFDQFGWSLLKWLWLTYYVGLSFWGAILGGMIYLVLRLNKDRDELFEWLDFMAIGVAGGVAIGLVGLAEWLGAGLFFGGFLLLWYLEGEYRTFEWYRGGRVDAKPGFLIFGFLMLVGLVRGGQAGWKGDWLEVALSGLAIILGGVGIYWRSGRKLRDDFKWLKLQPRPKLRIVAGRWGRGSSKVGRDVIK